MITIAVDAMGGDHAPRPEIEGSVLAARELGVRVVLVGQPPAIKHELAKYATRGLPVEIVPATEVITMEDSPMQAFRRKKDSSVHVAARLVRTGQADGFMSAGNTGAVMAVARFVLGTLPTVDRMALAAPFPNAKGGVSVILDVGANVDSRPEHLEQFAVMGEIYYRANFGTRRPRVALLSIGEEEMKGNELTRDVYNRLKRRPMNFVGNVEGREIFPAMWMLSFATGLSAMSRSRSVKAWRCTFLTSSGSLWTVHSLPSSGPCSPVRHSRGSGKGWITRRSEELSSSASGGFA